MLPGNKAGQTGNYGITIASGLPLLLRVIKNYFYRLVGFLNLVPQN